MPTDAPVGLRVQERLPAEFPPRAWVSHRSGECLSRARFILLALALAFVSSCGTFARHVLKAY
jgi:hypothetical protein